MLSKGVVSKKTCGTGAQHIPTWALERRPGSHLEIHISSVVLALTRRARQTTARCPTRRARRTSRCPRTRVRMVATVRSMWSGIRFIDCTLDLALISRYTSRFIDCTIDQPAKLPYHDFPRGAQTTPSPTRRWRSPPRPRRRSKGRRVGRAELRPRLFLRRSKLGNWLAFTLGVDALDRLGAGGAAAAAARRGAAL